MTTSQRFSAPIPLDGTWEFVPGSDRSGPASTIEVPRLWEAAGYPELDGEAWYRRTFEVQESAGRWTLEFGAVMDDADVFVNGMHVGAHRGAFTPFALDIGAAIRAGANLLEVRVWDIERCDPRHPRSAHGKQGWMHSVFPSPPSLYMTYGGIWQSVTLRCHGDARIDDVWINSNPDDLAVEVELNGTPGLVANVELAVLGYNITHSVHFGGASASVRFSLGPVDAAHWSPDTPVLHDLHVAARVDGQVSDARGSRFGLRVVGFSPAGLVVDGHLVKIKSALVQGFRADTLYAEGSRDAIAAEVLAAKDVGLNMLRLHIKAFDPRYLDVCDELGIFLHCDIPVAEPIAHDELDSVGPVADAAAEAAFAQVRRDRNHPSIVLWSAMNELGAEALDSRKTPGYENFVRRLYEVVSSADPTRPVIENDWIEPDPEEVFCSPVLTAHWYGRLSSEYLTVLAEKTRRWASGERPLFISEFGDWGLPVLDPERAEFWAYGASLGQAIGDSAWTGSIESFVEETQYYQGIANRLQIELFRSTPGVIGWCVTELTDVPQEFNGLVDLERNPKPSAIAEVRRAAQPTLPLMRRTSWTVEAGSALEDTIVVVNDGSALGDCRLRVRICDEEIEATVGFVNSGSTTAATVVRLNVPEHPGSHLLEIVVLDGEKPRGRNSYSLQVVGKPEPLGQLSTIADGRFEQMLVNLEAEIVSDPGVLFVIGEERLDAETGRLAGERLRAGGDVLVFAQPAAAAAHLPVAAQMAGLVTEWGSTPFLFTTNATSIASLPAQSVLRTELLEATPTAVWASLGDQATSVETCVGVFKPSPGQVVGTVVGRLRVHLGTLTLCQLPIMDSGPAGCALSRSLIGDVINYARAPLEMS